MDFTEVEIDTVTWRWRSSRPYREAPAPMYAYINIGRLGDGRWYAELQEVDLRLIAYPTEAGALTRAQQWRLGADWVPLGPHT